MTRAKLALAVATGPMYRQGDIHEWRTVAMKRAGFSIAMVVFVTPAFGQGAQGSSALALAALVAEHDVAMAPGDRSIVAGLLGGRRLFAIQSGGRSKSPRSRSCAATVTWPSRGDPAR